MKKGSLIGKMRDSVQKAIDVSEERQQCLEELGSLRLHNDTNGMSEMVTEIKFDFDGDLIFIDQYSNEQIIQLKDVEKLHKYLQKIFA